MRKEFEKMAAAGKLERHHIESLVQLTNSGFCMHRSWGFGRIRTVDTVFARFTIDFPNKAGHAMDLGFAAESLKPIAKDHILARKAVDLEGLRQLAATSHLELVKLVLASFGGKATGDQIQQVLVPEVIRDDWKKWWEAARRELRKDGHFQVPLKKTEAIIYQVKEVSLQDRLLEAFRAAKGLKARLAVAGELLKSVHDLSDKQAAAREIIAVLNAEIASYQRTQPAVALEAVFARDDVGEMAGLQPAEGQLDARAIWSQEPKLGPLMEALPAAKHRRALESFEAANPDRWHEVLRNTLNGISAKLCREFAGLLMLKGQLDRLKETLARLISQHTASSELLLWLAKDRNDVFADILGPEVFRAMLTAMERDQFNERRSNRLRDYILDDQELLVELIGSADLEVIKDLTRALQLSPCFDDMDKRSLLARIVKSYPAMQSLISGEQTKGETHWVVSWDSLERRKHEYRELVEKRIPANSKEIALARSYGDLRENHEYTAAKEMQKLLMGRKAELETQLVRARGTDFANPRTDVVSIGTVVRATDLATDQAEQFTILGAWDSEPDKGVVSYLSPVAQSLLNRKVGEEVEFEVNNLRHRHHIDAIEPFKTA
ncbi:MAG: GreA/GreB family elongation factor [Verrucomicrobiota bacterium]|jgi:transcription elongation GreA/GreB family factor